MSHENDSPNLTQKVQWSRGQIFSIKIILLILNTCPKNLFSASLKKAENCPLKPELKTILKKKQN